MALHPTAAMRYKFPQMSDLQIGGLEETDQQHGPPQTKISHHLCFSVVIYTNLVHTTKNIWDLCHLLEKINTRIAPVTHETLQKTWQKSRTV